MCNYRCSKEFCNVAFRETNNLSSEELVHGNKGLQLFCKVCIETLNNFALIKQKYTWENQIPFMTKELSKEILTRSGLRNNFLKKNRTEDKKLQNTKRRNKYACLLRSAKKKYHGNLDENVFLDNHQF